MVCLEDEENGGQDYNYTQRYTHSVTYSTNSRISVANTEIAAYLPETSSVEKRFISKNLSNKATLNNSKDIERPIGVNLECSGCEKCSDEKLDKKTHSSSHSPPRSAPDPYLPSPLPPEASSTPIPNSAKLESRDTSISTNAGITQVSRSTAASPTLNPAPSTPSAAFNRTYSFVFTSSRQPRAYGGDRVIGVVNPSLSRSMTSKAPLRPQNSGHHPSLTPEQIKAHALGAVHAMPEDSLFSTRDRTTSTVAQIEIPIKPSPPVSPEVSNEKEKSMQSIEYYMNAARAGRGARNDTRSPSPTRPIPHRGSLSYATSLLSLSENTSPMASQDSLNPPQDDQALVSRPKQRQTKGYTKYNESESQEHSFTSNTIVRPRNQSYDSSASSCNSKASLDESITGLSCFGTIGSGTPAAVFGTAVMSASRSLGPKHSSSLQTSSTLDATAQTEGLTTPVPITYPKTP